MTDTPETTPTRDTSAPTRAGFVALIGEPNAGKSTLLNRMVGAKVSIVTHKVQTTRTRIRGICMEGNAQTATRAKQAGRVDKDDLGVAFHADAADTGPGGLHLMRDDRDLGPNHPVQQRRFAGIGFTDEGNKSGAGRGAGVAGRGGFGCVSHGNSPAGPARPGPPFVRRRVSIRRGRFRPRRWQF